MKEFEFFGVLDLFWSYAISHSDTYVCAGDFNRNIVNPYALPVRRYVEILEAFGLRQVVNFSTRICATTSILLDHSKYIFLYLILF